MKKKPQISTLTFSLPKPKRGRPTILDDHLAGGRNQWASLLEESWPEIGWSLLQIRKNHVTSAIDDVRKAFQPVREKPHNSGLANPFYHDTVETATPAEVHRNRVRSGDLRIKIQNAYAKVNEVERSIQEMETILKTAASEYMESIQKEITQRREALAQIQSNIKQHTAEEHELNNKCLDQEAYVYASELLDFLCSSGRYAINPVNVANALAGLPLMRWRQSYLRCSRIAPQESRLHYKVLEIILDLWKRGGESKESVIEYFKVRLPKLPKKLGYTKDFLLENWRHLRSAIEECLTQERKAGEVPYILTSVFMRNTRTQNPLERVLAEQEKLKSVF